MKQIIIPKQLCNLLNQASNYEQLKLIAAVFEISETIDFVVC